MTIIFKIITDRSLHLLLKSNIKNLYHCRVRLKKHSLINWRRFLTIEHSKLESGAWINIPIFIQASSLYYYLLALNVISDNGIYI